MTRSQRYFAFVGPGVVIGVVNLALVATGALKETRLVALVAFAACGVATAVVWAVASKW